MRRKIDFKEICREIRCEENYLKKIEELTSDERYYLDIDVENNYKNMKANLIELLPAIGINPEKYKVGSKILIPIEEKEFCKRAYKERTSPIGKKIRGKSKKEITFEEIDKEIKGIEEVAFQSMSKEDAEFEIGKIKYEQNYHTLKRIEEVKMVIEENIYDKMRNLTLEDIDLSGADAICLIDFLVDMIVITSKEWQEVVKHYKSIRNNDSDSRIVANESTGEYYVDENINFKTPQTILKEALIEKRKKLIEQIKD